MTRQLPRGAEDWSESSYGKPSWSCKVRNLPVSRNAPHVSEHWNGIAGLQRREQRLHNETRDDLNHLQEQQLDGEDGFKLDVGRTHVAIEAAADAQLDQFRELHDDMRTQLQDLVHAINVTFANLTEHVAVAAEEERLDNASEALRLAGDARTAGSDLALLEVMAGYAFS